MSWSVLRDPEKQIAVYFCTTTGTALGHIQAFTGGSAVTQAEDFSDYLHYHYGEADPRAYEANRLGEYLSEWREQAFDDDDRFTPTTDIDAQGNVVLWGRA